MILTKEVEVIPSGKMISYYKNKGYDAKYHVPLLVKVEDLSSGSKTKIEVQCDYCGEIKTIQYNDYLKSIKLEGKYSCIRCAYNKAFKTNLRLYGSESYSSTIECRDKVIKTNIDKYGVRNSAMLENVKEKIKQTNLKKYGCEYSLQSNIVKEKSRKTCLAKYGVEYALQSDKIREKGAQTYFKHSSKECSKQQFYLYSLYKISEGVELNYPILCYNVDICFPSENLVLEYDGGGHDLPIKTGRLTQEEFNQKEIIRNNTVKKAGYKQMRIISSKDKLPSDQILLQMLDDAKQYFSQYPNHSWIEFNIDTSTVRSVEYKDGVCYDYGNLRTIKDIA